MKNKDTYPLKFLNSLANFTSLPVLNYISSQNTDMR